ncbi:MAG TPA: transcription termination factor Rho [Mesotoga infera]|uniref:Transcription termination factor Rho n=1 Tax=Mesotoga infera TaxID=1236046 RepID=A0A7C1H719_9BACT|nr:transcription termination factor Rho [Mesotoga infera]
MNVPSNLSPRKKKTEETPGELEEKVVAEKKTTRKRTTRKKTESKRTEDSHEAVKSVSRQIAEEKDGVEISPKEDPKDSKAENSVTKETGKESIPSDVKEIPRKERDKDKDKDKDKDNIREVEIDISQLQAMPIRDVYKLARKYDVQGYTQMAKKDLIFAVLKAQTESYGYFFDQGVLEITDGGYGFLRTLDNNLLPSSNDIYVSQSQIRRFNLTSGDTVAGQVRPPKEGEKYFALLRIEAINHKAINFAAERITFQNLTPIHPEDKLITETESHIMSTRMVDLFSPIGKGQRGLIVSPPKAGKTILLKELANGIAENHPDTVRIILLIDERPEEVTDLRRSSNAHVIAAPFDMHPEKQIRVAEMTIEMAKRLVEFNYDVVILLDSITRLARAYNLYVPPSGKLLSGGVDPSALYKPKYFFGAARNIEEGGSLTIIATALVETGSKMDEVIFEEFKGTGNMELILSRQLANKRMFPSINLTLSGTRREELLLPSDILRKVWVLRRMLSSMSEEEGLRLIMDKLRGTATNEEFLDLIEMEKKSY